MTDEKLVELVQKIEKRTLVGGLKWEKTAVEEEFQTALANFVIRIRRDASNGPDVDYLISLLDSTGTDLETLSDVELKRTAERNHIYGVNSFELMQSIFRNAKRKALGLDKALDDVLSELGDDPTP